MKTTKRAFNISIKTSKSLEEIYNVISEQVEFEHSKKITSMQLVKPLFGDKLDHNKYQLFKKPAIPGAFDMKAYPFPKALMEIDNGIISIQYQDSLKVMYYIMNIFVLLFFTQILLFTEPDSSEIFVYTGVTVIFSILIQLIRISRLKSLIRQVEKVIIEKVK